MRKRSGCQNVQWCNLFPAHNSQRIHTAQRSAVWRSNAIHALKFSFYLAPLLHWMRCCRLHTPSRENQVQPEVFEMVNATGNSVSCSPSECGSHRLCLCVAVCTHTGTWLIILGTACRIIFSTDSPGWTLLILCYVWVCVHVCERVWMQLGATYSVFALVISLEPDCHPICLRVGTLGNPAMFSCAALVLYTNMITSLPYLTTDCALLWNIYI